MKDSPPTQWRDDANNKQNIITFQTIDTKSMRSRGPTTLATITHECIQNVGQRIHNNFPPQQQGGNNP
jgi:hypothetical protein